MAKATNQFAAVGLNIVLGLVGAGCAHGGHGTSVDHEDKDEHKSEQDIAVDKLPPAVVASVKAAMPDGTITDAEKENTDERAVYELDVKSGGKKYELHVAEDGKVLKSEEDKD